MLQVLIAMLVMVARDASVEFLTISQVRGNAKLAALLGPVVTITGIAVTVLGAGPVIQHGLTIHATAVLLGILVMDTIDGYVFTRLGRRINNGEEDRRAAT